MKVKDLLKWIGDSNQIAIDSVTLGIIYCGPAYLSGHSSDEEDVISICSRVDEIGEAEIAIFVP